MLLCMCLNAINNAGMLNRFKAGVMSEEGVNTSRYEKQLFDSMDGTCYSEKLYDDMLKTEKLLYDGEDESKAREKGIYAPEKRFDRYVYSTVINMLLYCNSYTADIDYLIENTRQLKDNNLGLGDYCDWYKDKEAQVVIDKYTKLRNEISPKISYTKSAYWWCFSVSQGANNFGNEMLLLFICCVTVCFFVDEYQSGAIQMTFVTSNGRLYLFALKNVILFAFNLVVVLLSCGVDALIISMRMGSVFTSVGQPIQMVYDSEAGAIAEFCPMDITFGQYMLLVCLMRFIALCFVTVVCEILSVIFRKGIWATLYSVVFSVGLLEFTKYVSQTGLMYYEKQSDTLNKVYIWLKTYSPISLLWCNDYIAGYDGQNVLGYPINRIWLVLFLSVMWIIGLCAIGGFLYCRRGGQHEAGIGRIIKKVWGYRGLD